jgi:hypothetical protein
LTTSRGDRPRTIPIPRSASWLIWRPSSSWAKASTISRRR